MCIVHCDSAVTSIEVRALSFLATCSIHVRPTHTGSAVGYEIFTLGFLNQFPTWAGHVHRSALSCPPGLDSGRDFSEAYT